MLVICVGCGQAPPTGDLKADLARAEALKIEVSSLKVKLANAQSRFESLREQIDSGSAPSATGGMPVPEILDELMQTSKSSKNRSRARRRLSYLFESLALEGDAAVPLIREFLTLVSG